MMTVEKLKNFEPLFGSWTVESKIAEGRYSKVFKVAKVEDGQVRRQCVKTVKFPSGNEELNEVISSGVYQNVQQYLDEVELSVRKNMDKMLSLRGNKNIVCFDNYTIIKEKSCFYLVILMELLKPLNDYLKVDSAVQNDVIKIGTDLCNALEGFREIGIIHHEIRPENIYVDSKGNFKLGDFGVCKGRFGEDKVVSSYIAPELYNNGTIDISSDIYSLGILLYKLLNNNRLPFLPSYPSPISLSDRELAFERRIRGDLFPAPSNATAGLATVIFKATAFKAHERYIEPSQLLRDLEANYTYAPPIQPVTPLYTPTVSHDPSAAYGVPLYADNNEASQGYNDEYYDQKSEFDEAFSDDDDDDDSSDTVEKVDKKWYFIIVALVIILAVAIGFVAKGGKEKVTTTASTTTTQAITFGSETTTAPTTASTTASTTESTTASTTASTTVKTSTDAPSAVTTTTDPSTTKATTTTQAPSSTTQTTETSTTETTTEPVYVEPSLFYDFNVEGGEDESGRVYTSVNGTVATSFGSGRDATVKINGLTGKNATVDESKIYIYTLDGNSTVDKSNVTATLVNGSDGSVSCFVSASDENFKYDPENYQYFICIEEEAIKTDKAINLGLQVRV